MSSSILSTKLHYPAVQSDMIERPRLLKKLDDSLKSKLTIISAPAGFGKTTLLSDWISKQILPVGWVTLDSEDNDPIRMLTYCIAAMQRLEPGFGKSTLALLQSPGQAPPEIVLTTLINDLSKNPNETVLVLDDYHLIESKEVHQSLIYFLEHAPKHTHLIISSRHDPPLPLARLRASKQLMEVREADMRFTSEEAASFFKITMNLKLTDEDIEELEKRTEGWVASLQLAGLAMQSRKNVQQFIKEFGGSHSFIVDYLTEEVLQHQSAEIQEFLLKTSILKRFNASLCEAVTHRNNSHKLLQYLDASKLFIVPLEESKIWFRYHQLFGDLLQYKLKQQYAEIISELHMDASRWYEENDYTDEALNHALAAGDHVRAADLIEAAAVTTLVNGRLATFKRWVEKLPYELVSERAYILVCNAWIHYMSSEIEKIRPILSQIEKSLTKQKHLYDEDAVVDIKGHVSLLRSLFFSPLYTGNPQDQEKHRELILQAKLDVKKDNYPLLSTLELVLGGAYAYEGEWNLALEAFNNSWIYGDMCNNHLVSLTGIYNQSEVLIVTGKTDQALNLNKVIAAKSEDRFGKNFPLLGFPYLSLGEIYYMMNFLDKAEDFLSRSIEMAEMMGNGTLFIYALYRLALIKFERGGFKEAKELLKKEDTVLKSSYTLFKELPLEVLKTQLWLKQKNLKPAQVWLSAFIDDKMKDTPWYLQGKLAAARIYIETEDFFNAISILQDAVHKSQKINAKAWAMEGLILLSKCFYLEGETDRAAQNLIEALSIAEESEPIRSFLREGKPIEDLLKSIISGYSKEDSFSLSLATRLLDEFKKEKNLRTQPLLEPLSGREIEVLKYLAAGYSNKAIAEKLYVAVGTVKKHTHAIYQKLNVDSRTKAVKAAREYHLI